MLVRKTLQITNYNIKLTVHFNQKKVQGWFTAIKNPGLQKKTGFFIFANLKGSIEPLWRSLNRALPCFQAYLGASALYRYEKP